MRTLNVRLLAIVVLGGVVLAGVVFGAHHLQMRRHAGFFLDRAREAAKSESFLTRAEDARKYYEQYLKLKPEDLDAREELGTMLADLGRQDPQLQGFAASHLERVVRDDSSRKEARRTLVDLLMFTRHHSQAQKHLEAMCEEEPENGELLRLYAQCQLSAADWESATATLMRATEKAPDDIESYELLVRFTLSRTDRGSRESREREAMAILDKMVEANPDLAKAYTTRGEFLFELGKAEEAKKDVQKARELAPKDPEVLILGIHSALAEKDVEAARRDAEQLVEVDPKQPMGYDWCSRIAAASGDLDGAIGWLDKGLASTTDAPASQFGLSLAKAELLLGSGRAAEAEALIAKLREMARTSYHLARVRYVQAQLDYRNKSWRKALDEFEAARPALEASRDARRQLAEGYVMAADCHRRLDDPERAQEALERARELGFVSAASQQPMVKVAALAQRGRTDEAIEECRKVLAAEDAPPEARLVLAGLLVQRTLRVEEASKRDWTEADEAIQRAAEALPGDPRVVQLKAQALQSQDRAADAEKALRDAASASLPEWKRWTELLKSVTAAPDDAQAAAALDKAIQEWGKEEKDLTQAKELVEKGDRPRAVDALLRARDSQSGYFDLITALAQMIGGVKDWEKLSGLLDEAEAQAGDDPRLRMLRAQLYVSRDGKKAIEALKGLEQGIESFPKSQRMSLQNSLSRAAELAGDYAGALRLREAIALETPEDLTEQTRTFDLAAQAKDRAAMARAMERIEKIEGQGPWWHLCQAKEVLVPKEGAKPDYKKALEHLATAIRLRPRWDVPHILAGEIHLRMNDAEAATKSYREAVALGASNATLLTRLELLLRQQGQTEEANVILARLERQNAAITPSSRFARGLESLQGNRAEEGLADIQQATEDQRVRAADSDDFRQHLQLAQYLVILSRLDKKRGQTAEAEKNVAEAKAALRRAIELAPGELDPWQGLVSLTHAEGTAEDVQAVLDDARGKVPEEKRALILGRCLEMLGRFAEAEDQYKAFAEAAKPDDSAAQQLARFYFVAALRSTGEASRAFAEKRDSLLGQMIDGKVAAPPKDVLWARLVLAETLLTRRGYANRNAALKVLDEALAADPQSATARRLKAKALAQHGSGRDRKEARRLFEELLKGQQSEPGDRFDLAKLLVLDGDWTAATREIRTLLATPKVAPEWLQFYIHQLIEHNELVEAESNLRVLDRLNPGVLANMVLRAELLSRRGDHDEALKTLTAFVEDSKAGSEDRVKRLAQGFMVAEDLASRLTGAERDAAAAKYLAAAEDWLAKVVRDYPRYQLEMVAFLGRRGRYDEALELAETAWTKGQPVEVATRVAGLAVSGEGDLTPQQMERIESILTAAIEKHGQQVPLLLGLADLRNIQKRYDDAEKLFREVLKREPDNYLAMNNLAVYLALRKIRVDEAIQLLDKAIEIAGPLPALCDSRATAYTAAGRWKEALEDLDLAISEEPTAVRYFHKALALVAGDQKEEAAKAFRQALDRGLSVDQLPPLERPAFRELQEELQ